MFPSLSSGPDAPHHGRYVPSLSSGPDALHHGWHGPEGQLGSEILVPQLQFLHVVDFLVVVHRLIPTVQTLCLTRKIAQLLLNTVIHVPVALVVQVILVVTQRLFLPVVCNDRCPGYVPQLQLIYKVVYTPVVAQSFKEIPQLSVHMVVDVPVAQVVQDIPVGTQMVSFSIEMLVDMVSFDHRVFEVPVVLVVRVQKCRRGEDSRAPTVALVGKLDALRPLRVLALLGAAHHRGDELMVTTF